MAKVWKAGWIPAGRVCGKRTWLLQQKGFGQRTKLVRYSDGSKSQLKKGHKIGWHVIYGGGKSGNPYRKLIHATVAAISGK